MNVRVGVFCSLVLSLLFVLLYSSSARGARQQLELPSAMVVGRVYCDSTCFCREFSKSKQFISGASVAVECRDTADKLDYRKVARTDRRGVFRVRLKASTSKHAKSIEASCSVKLLESNEPLCGVASPSTAAGIRLMSKRNGVHVYSAGFSIFKPMTQPEYPCGRRRPVSSERKLAQLPAFFLAPPSIPLVPSPPSIGPVPLPANPLFPPPSLLPPNPLQPPPPSVLPPNPLQPPSPPAFNFPPVPFLTPPPPPPPPVLPFPPVPVVPIPRVPGVPPAEAASP